MFPPIPSWDALHPLIIHFPIALLLGAPMLILLGLLLRRHSTGLFIAAFALMALGTIAVYFAVATGEAAGELAERTRLIFTALTAIFAVVLFGPMLFKRRPGFKSSLVLNLAFLLLYAAGSIVLINVGHQGGRLVHEFGVRASSTTTSTTTSTVSETKEGKREEDH